MRQKPLLKWITAKSASAGGATQKLTVNIPSTKANRFIIGSFTLVQTHFVDTHIANFDVNQRMADRTLAEPIYDYRLVLSLRRDARGVARFAPADRALLSAGARKD